MIASLPDGFVSLVESCRQAAHHYQGAARVVGDPGLRLQFKHLAAARHDLGDVLGTVVGVTPVEAPIPMAEGGAVPLPWGGARASGSDPRSCADADGRVPLGGEEGPSVLDHGELHALVQALRQNDEAILGDLHRLRTGGAADVAAEIADALDRAVETLLGDLEKMRILEDLARTQPQPAGPR
ncbi:hypothetical protein [Caenispirillum salinarum]|uniref:hypothetical protein n=1 Tax=Caenispirillum salinarum TaxID=859058 RepID=UPI00384F82DC